MKTDVYFPTCPNINQMFLLLHSQRRSSVIEITGNNSEWSESEDQEDDTQEEGDMELDGDISSSNDSSSFSTGDW